MPDQESQQEWDEVVQKELGVLQRQVAHGHPTFLDSYGAQNQAEFFAVASEAFIEEPDQLKHHHAKLFELFCRYYQFDPRTGWPLDA